MGVLDPRCRATRASCTHGLTMDPLAALRLGQLLVYLDQAAAAIRSGRKVASPSGALRQPLDDGPHPGHWLTRRQVYDLSKALSEVERISAEVRERVWPHA